nr:cytochrome P450 [Agasicles hygrophila]
MEALCFLNLFKNLHLKSTTEILLATTVFTFIAWSIQYTWKRRHLYKYGGKVNGPISLPIIGSSLYFLGSNADIFEKIFQLYDIYKPPFKLWFGTKLFYGISDAAQSEIILTRCLKKDSVYKKAEIVMGNGLFTADLDLWKKHRKMIMPTFNQQNLDSFVDIFFEQGVTLNKKLNKEVNKGAFDVFHYLSLYTLDIICETAMGVKVNAQNKNAEYPKWADRIMEVVLLRIFNLLYYIDYVFFRLPIGREVIQITKKMQAFSFQVVQDKKQAFEIKQQDTDTVKDYAEENEGKRRRKALLDYLLEATNDTNIKFTEKELREEVDTFIIAGFDTTASTNAFVLMMLGMFPQLQEKVYNEAIEILGPDGPPTPSDLSKLKYLELFIKETMRLFPVGAFIARTADKDIDLGDCILPKGASAFIAILKIHTDPKYWPDPYKFDPYRFLPENSKNRAPCTYLPFSYGPRNCVGLKYAMMAIKTLIVTIIRKYEISTPFKQVQDVKLKANMVIRPIDGYLISLTYRK